MTDPFKEVSSELECCICKNKIKDVDGHLEVIENHPIYGEKGKVYCIWCLEEQELNAILDMPIEDLPLYMFNNDLISKKATKLAQKRLLEHNPNNPPKTELDIFLDANPI